MGIQEGRNNVCYMHLTLLPYIPTAGELKTKPTQHSVKELREIGIQPDILLCRAEREIPISERRKIALFCNVAEECVIEALDVKSIYLAPKLYGEQGIDTQVLKHFGMDDSKKPDLSKWNIITERIENPKSEVTIAIVGKYLGMGDTYKSLCEALDHAGIASNAKVNFLWVDAQGFEDKDAEKLLKSADAVLVPGGFGERGVAGKIAAVTYARENKVPYFGICFGMQIAVIEFARNVLGIKDATSSEFGDEDTADERGPLIGLMTQWQKGSVKERRSKHDGMGGTMRLGAYEAELKAGSRVAKMYDATKISERHRHRYEVNIAYRDQMEKAGLTLSGLSPNGELPEIVELENHPWFVGVQFHPEFKSRPFAPHPIFFSFVEAALANAKKAKKAA
jgi:CTP synthase